ncbi:hypothetical protein V6X69_03475, partial [Spiribacter sp. 370]
MRTSAARGDMPVKSRGAVRPDNGGSTITLVRCTDIDFGPSRNIYACRRSHGAGAGQHATRFVRAALPVTAHQHLTTGGGAAGVYLGGGLKLNVLALDLNPAALAT